MAKITAFQGIRYNAHKVGDLSLVVSQPYDRVRYGLLHGLLAALLVTVLGMLLFDVPFNGTGFFPHDDVHFDWWDGGPRTTTTSNNVDAYADRDVDAFTDVLSPAALAHRDRDRQGEPSGYGY